MLLLEAKILIKFQQRRDLRLQIHFKQNGVKFITLYGNYSNFAVLLA